MSTTDPSVPTVPTVPTDSIISAESGGNPAAKNPNSSASGPGQFLDSTWLSTVRQHRPDLAGQSDSDLLSLKNDPALSRDMTTAYAQDNQATLRQAGLPVTPGTTYLAHFAGPGGAVKVLQADPGADVGDLLGAGVVKANPFLKGMTASGLQSWAAKKMGVQAAAPGVRPSQAAPPLPAPPLPAPPSPPIFAGQQAAPGAPQPSPPIFAGQPPSAGAAPQPSAAAPQPSAPAAPIFALQPPPETAPVDLSGLRAALAARAPLFARRG